MTIVLSRKVSYSPGFCLLMMVGLVTPMPTLPFKRSAQESFTKITESGFSNSPRVLEIQLPLKLASKEDLVAWARYVMGLMASKINITLSTVKDSMENGSQGIMKPLDMSTLPLEPIRNRPTVQISGVKASATVNEPSFKDRRVNFEVSSIQDINIGSPFGTNGEVTAPDWTNDSKTRNNHEVPSPLTRRDGQFFAQQYTDFERRPSQALNNGPILPSNTYLPLPVKTSESAKFINDEFTTGNFFDTPERSTSRNSPVLSSDLRSSMRKSVILNQRVANVTSNKNESESNYRRNVTDAIRPILTLPFEAVITITREEKPETTTLREENADYLVIPTRDPPDEFPPYFEKNYTIANESGQVNVILEDVGDDLERVNEDNVTKGKSKKDQPKKERSRKEQSRKQQTAALIQLMRMLATLRKSGNNSLPTKLTPPPSKLTTRIKSQRVQLLDDVGQDKRNETSQAQEFEDQADYDDEDGGMGGSIQSLLELLPLVAPILEDLSDPESETDITELLQAGIPILEGLSEGDGENPGPDIPGILVPILLNILGGRDGEGSDANALLGPLIQLLAPLIGPVVGPLIGPLTRQSSNAPTDGGSNIGTLVQGIVGPLSMPTGPGKMSPVSNLIAGVVASLSKNLINGKDGVDLKSVVSAVVSGSIWGASAALSAPKDTVYAPTSYGGDRGQSGYGYGVPANSVNPFALIGSSIKEILTGVLKVSSTLIQALSSILGASSQGSPKPSYGPPSNYGPPPSYQAQQTYSTTTRPAQKSRASRKQIAG